MSEHLENSTERLIEVCQLMSKGAESVRSLLEKRLADFRAGRAELDAALADLNERRAKFIQDSSETAADETSQAMDALAERMKQLLTEGPFDFGGERVEAAVPAPAGADSPQTTPLPVQPAPRELEVEVADELPEAVVA